MYRDFNFFCIDVFGKSEVIVIVLVLIIGLKGFFGLCIFKWIIELKVFLVGFMLICFNI